MSLTMTSNKDRLDQVRQRLQRARAQRSKAMEAVTLAQQTGDTQAEQAARSALDGAVIEIEQAQQLESVFLSQVAGVSGYQDRGFLDDPEAVSMLERLATTRQPVGRVELGAVMSVDEMCSMINTGAWGQPKMGASLVPDTAVGRRGPYTELGLIPQPRRRLSILDLIPTSPAVGNTIPYVIETGSFDTATETAESAVKPTGDVGLADGEAPIRTIAHFLKAPRQVLADVPGLEQAIRTRLVYGVMRRLENQVLAGDGTGQNLTGVLTTSGVASVAYAAGTPLADLSLQGIVDVINSNAEPDAAVMNATTLQSLLTPKASGSGEYMNIDSPFGTGPQNLSLWGIPVVTSSAMANNQVLFGSFGLGAHLWVREAANVILGLDSDDLTRNRVTLLGEGRFGVTINVPAYFALVHLA
jgi:HK97 family phage major capsid protein